jgi:hypothetical protein
LFAKTDSAKQSTAAGKINKTGLSCIQGYFASRGCKSKSSAIAAVRLNVSLMPWMLDKQEA